MPQRQRLSRSNAAVPSPKWVLYPADDRTGDMVRFVESQYLSKEYQKQFWASNKNARGFDHPVVEFFACQRIEYIRRHIDLASVRSAFDVGCGDGFATHDFAEIVPRVEGGDISKLMLEHNPIDRGSLRVIDAADPEPPHGSYEAGVHVGGSAPPQRPGSGGAGDGTRGAGGTWSSSSPIGRTCCSSRVRASAIDRSAARLRSPESLPRSAGAPGRPGDGRV